MSPSPRRHWTRRGLIGALLVAAFAAGGFVAGRQVPGDVLALLLKYAIGLLGIVWLLSVTVYNKLSDVTDMQGLDHRQHRHLEIEVQGRLRWFWAKAASLGLVALAMSAPGIWSDTSIGRGTPPPPAVFALAFGAFGLAVFFLRRLWADMEEIRVLRSRVRELERREKERAERVKSLKEDSKGGWPADERLAGFRHTEPPPADPR
jgi:hypothetical protein